MCPGTTHLDPAIGWDRDGDGDGEDDDDVVDDDDDDEDDEEPNPSALSPKNTLNPISQRHPAQSGANAQGSRPKWPGYAVPFSEATLK